jgi:hypothetical protein
MVQKSAWSKGRLQVSFIVREIQEVLNRRGKFSVQRNDCCMYMFAMGETFFSCDLV